MTGNLVGDIVDAGAKKEILLSLAEREGLSVEQIVAVGDGANDIQMLASAGLGIAFNAKPIVEQHAQASLKTLNLEPILYFLGIPGLRSGVARYIANREIKMKFNYYE